MHPPFFAIMDEIQEGLRYLFQTKSKYGRLVSGTGHAGSSHIHLICVVLPGCPEMFNF